MSRSDRAQYPDICAPGFYPDGTPTLDKASRNADDGGGRVIFQAADDPFPRKTTAPDFLHAAIGHMEDRATTYDKPTGERSMAATVAAFNAATGHALSETDGWIFMCLLKIVRSRQGDYRADNFEDLAAYAGLAGESAVRAKELAE